MISILTALLLSGAQDKPMLKFVDRRANEARKFECPSESVIKEFTATRDDQEIRFHVVMQSNSTSTSKEAVVLECHVLYGEYPYVQRVAVIGIQGTVEETAEVPGLGTLRRKQGLLFGEKRKSSALKVEMLKSGTTFSVPVPAGEPVRWYAITRWRPSGLSTNFSPSSLWWPVVSVKRSPEAKPSKGGSLPSLNGFLKYYSGG